MPDRRLAHAAGILACAWDNQLAAQGFQWGRGPLVAWSHPATSEWQFHFGPGQRSTGRYARVQIAPKEEQELQALRSYKGPIDALKPPEQLLHMLASVPRALAKIQVLIERATFSVRPSCRHAFKARGLQLHSLPAALHCCQGSATGCTG